MTEDAHKSQAETWFKSLRDTICAAFEGLEEKGGDPSLPAGRFERKSWERPGGGGGVMSGVKGRVFDKVGVNVSTVHGAFPEDFAKTIPGAGEDPRFWASGISLVAHMRNPRVPSVHMNTRMIVTTKSWFGGGADLTPAIEFQEDTQHFHQTLKTACDRHDSSDYPKFKAWCEDYFFQPHSNEARGVGGIFYDTLNSGDWTADFAFTRDVGTAFIDAFVPLVERRMMLAYSAEDRQKQLIKRGRYTEFNLLYDRGTLFGLKTGGNTEAILMSLPPEASWP